jgi:penicillin amidase
VVAELTGELGKRARTALPPVEGRLAVPGLTEPVEVLRDRWGCPHIYAANAHDLYFAQGFVTASERLFQMELAYRYATGRLAEMFSDLVLPLDRFVRTVGWNRAGVRLGAKADELSLEIGEAFTEGHRAWVDRMDAPPLEYDVLQLDPWVPNPSDAANVAGALSVFMAWTLSTNWDNELLRMELAEALGWESMLDLFPEVGPEPAAVFAGLDDGPGGRRSAFDLLRAAPPLPTGQGSNNWVVAGSRSATGKPLLANDPHLLVQMPSVWFEVHLVAPGVDVRGVAFPFAPGVIIGHNDRVAWGFTNVGGDTQDLYLERLNEAGTAAWYGKRWEPLTIHREEIAVRGRDEPEVLEVRESRHGPILDSYLVGMGTPTVVEGGITRTYALRFVGFDEAVQLSTIAQLDAARTFEEFRAAAAEWSCPGQNFVYADVEGNIGYQCTGRYPIRRQGDGTIPVPGWTAAFEWEGFVPFEELPWSYNPPRGYLGTANNKIHDDAYPWLLGKDFLPPFRARRIAELIAGTPAHDRDSFARMQVDTFSIPATMLVPLLARIEATDPRQAQALKLLEAWDHRLDADSAAAAIYEVWLCRLSEAILRPRLGERLFEHFYGRRQWTNSFHYQVLPNLLRYPRAAWFGADGAGARDAVLRSSLDASLDQLEGLLGPDLDSWRWDDVHRIRFAGQLAIIPDVAQVFTGGEAGIGGDEQTLLATLFEPGLSFDTVNAPSWRQVVDLADLDASVGILPVGQSGHPASPHYADQFPLWASGQYHPLPYSRRAVEQHLESRMELVPPD